MTVTGPIKLAFNLFLALEKQQKLREILQKGGKWARRMIAVQAAFGSPFYRQNCITTAIKRQTSKLKCTPNNEGGEMKKFKNKTAATTMGRNNKNNRDGNKKL